MGVTPGPPSQHLCLTEPQVTCVQFLLRSPGVDTTLVKGTRQLSNLVSKEAGVADLQDATRGLCPTPPP